MSGDMTQTAMDVGDGLTAPFYAITYRHGVPNRWDDDELFELLWHLRASDEAGDCYVQEIGDANGPLWKMDSPRDHQAAERAPAKDPYSLLPKRDWE